MSLPLLQLVLAVVISSGGVAFLDLVAVRKVCSNEERKRWNGLLADCSWEVEVDEKEISTAAGAFGEPDDGRTKGMGLFGCGRVSEVPRVKDLIWSP